MNRERTVMIFIDYENVHKLMIHEKKNLLGVYFFEKLRKWCEKEKLRILDIKVYCNFDITDLHNSKHQSKLQSYGLETFHTSNKGKNYADLKITTDLLEELYENTNINGFIIISNDKDMTPLIKMVKRYKDFIYLITNKNCYDIALKNFPDKQINIEDILNEIKDEEIDVEIKEYKKIEEELLENLEDFFKKSENKGKVHSFDYYIENTVSYFAIYEYELLTLLKNICQDSKLVLYRYQNHGKNFIGIFPKSKEKDFLNLKPKGSYKFKPGTKTEDEDLLKNDDLLEIEEVVSFFEEKIKKSYEKFDK